MATSRSEPDPRTGRPDTVDRLWLRDRISERQVGPEQLVEPHGGPAVYELGNADVSRGTARLTLLGAIPGGGSVTKTIIARDRQIELKYELEGVHAARFGPEIPVSVWPGSPRLRVDGAEWIEVDGPLAANGHRFRFEHVDRAAQVVVDLRLPGAILAIPLVARIRNEWGEEDEVYQGVALWPHFLVGGAGTYTMTVSIEDVKGSTQ